jgi:hypothetical protein
LAENSSHGTISSATAHKCSKHAAIRGLLLLFVMFTLIYITVIVKTT